MLLEPFLIIIIFSCGLFLGLAIAWLFWAKNIKAVKEGREELATVFKALSLEALRKNNETFLQTAASSLEKFHVQAAGELEQRKQAVEAIIAPLHDTLQKVELHLKKSDEIRQETYIKLTEQIKNLAVAQQKLHLETDHLVKALRAPTVRGRWGEIQLKRVVEIAGMLPYCDFTEQKSKETDQGRIRPDLVVNLPGGKKVVVDAKTPLQSYLEAVEARDEEERRKYLRRHAREVREHIKKLSSKAYWRQFVDAPEFVVMFLPGEHFFSAALEFDPGLIEEGVRGQVILATPTTLISLLKAVAYGWRQESMAENAKRISSMAEELYDRACTFTAYFSALGKAIDRSIVEYNKAVGSLEGRMLPTLRRMAEFGIGSKKKMPSLPEIEKSSRKLRSKER